MKDGIWKRFRDGVWKNHVFRPVLVLAVLVAVFFIVRAFLVPADFGTHGDRYAYDWYRAGNVAEWEEVEVKYQGKDYCKTCHEDQFDRLAAGPHSIIQCENCHGPAILHPKDPPKLAIDRAREQCLRCHALLDYPSSPRADIAGIDPSAHNGELECANCHDAHGPTRETTPGVTSGGL